MEMGDGYAMEIQLDEYQLEEAQHSQQQIQQHSQQQAMRAQEQRQAQAQYGGGGGTAMAFGDVEQQQIRPSRSAPTERSNYGDPSMAAMMNNLRELLNEFIADTDAEFDRLMKLGQAQEI